MSTASSARSLGSEVTRRYGAAGLPDDTIRLHFQGLGGSELRRFVPHGITLILEGDANDYVGKGLSGGRIVVEPPPESTFKADGQRDHRQRGPVRSDGRRGVHSRHGRRAFRRAQQRRQAVVLAVGDHGCEYMTGGRVVVLGPTGKNFAAGMSGGMAYVYDEDGSFPQNCNKEMVQLYPLEDAEDVEEVQELIRGSPSTPAASGRSESCKVGGTRGRIS